MTVSTDIQYSPPADILAAVAEVAKLANAGTPLVRRYNVVLPSADSRPTPSVILA